MTPPQMLSPASAIHTAGDALVRRGDVPNVAVGYTLAAMRIVDAGLLGETEAMQTVRGLLGGSVPQEDFMAAMRIFVQTRRA